MSYMDTWPSWFYSPVSPRYFIYFFIGSRELSYFTYFIEALSPSLIAFYRSYMVPAYSVIRSALSLRLVFIKWMLIHLMRHRGYQLGGYPYRTDFDPCQGVILSELYLRRFPGIYQTHCDSSELVNTCEHLSWLCNHFWLPFPSDTTWVWTPVARI